MTEEQLEKEIEEKQKQLHEMRYGEIDKAYEEFNKSKEEAIKKYKLWRNITQVLTVLYITLILGVYNASKKSC